MAKKKTSKARSKAKSRTAYGECATLSPFGVCLADCREFAPSLLAARASLLPFADVICGWSAGPQPQSDDYDPNDEPYFTLDIDDPSNRDGETWARVTESRVIVIVVTPTGEGEEVFAQEIETTLQGLWDYLRQIPRSAGGFFSSRSQL
jgi:hypothetical protein